MTAIKELKIINVILLPILLYCVNSFAQENRSNVFGTGYLCSDSETHSQPPMIGMPRKCKATPSFYDSLKETDNTLPMGPTPVNVAPPAAAAPTTNKPLSVTPEPEADTTNAAQPRVDSTIDISRQILRETELSLNAKEKELSIGFHYAKNDSKSDLRFSRGRVITMPIEFNMGLTNRLSLNASLPLLYYNREVITTAYSSDTSDTAVGDLTLGLSYKARIETDKHSSITTSISSSVPTKKSSSNDSADLGSKFIGVRAGVSVSKSISPAILFFNLGYKHYFPQSNSSSSLLPGNSFSYGYGAGLSINSVLTFSGRVAGHYSKKSKRNGETLLGTNSEPVNLNLAINYKLDKKKMLTYGIQFGINNDANDSAMSLTFVWGL